MYMYFFFFFFFGTSDRMDFFLGICQLLIAYNVECSMTGE